jgi:hypothetical protein
VAGYIYCLVGPNRSAATGSEFDQEGECPLSPDSNQNFERCRNRRALPHGPIFKLSIG